MKLLFYFLALLACLTEMLLYAFFSAWVGWKNGGGTIPMGILLGIMVITWKVIVGLRKKKADSAKVVMKEESVDIINCENEQQKDTI